MDGRSDSGYLTHDLVMQVYNACARPPTAGRIMTKTRVTIECWIYDHTFDPSAVMKHREEIVRMLLCLPPGIRVDEKGGLSVGYMVFREDNTMWTGDPMAVERLAALGIACGLAEFCSPRSTWPNLPEGLPFLRVLIPKTGVTVN